MDHQHAGLLLGSFSTLLRPCMRTIIAISVLLSATYLLTDCSYLAPSYSLAVLSCMSFGMATVRAVAPKSNGLRPTDQISKEITEYEKIIRLRDEIFANTHPRLKVLVQAPSQDRQRPAESPPSIPAPRAPNGVPKLPGVDPPIPNLSKDLIAPASRPSSSLQQSSNALNMVLSGSGSSGIDPIFLTKSEVLVKAELQQKRQRIERALEEQNNQKKVIARQRTFDQDAIPEFDITDVLKKAHELVKPFKAPEVSGANGSASSDSFDDNTFYSSEMNESTTQEADRSDRSPKWRSNKPCNHFLEGHCPYAEACAFSHDPTLKCREKADRHQAMDIGNVATDEQANPHPQDRVQQALASNATPTIPPSKLSRIAELEEQLRLLKSQQAGAAEPISSTHAKEPSDEEPMYSPPDARVPGLHEQLRPGSRVIEIEEDQQRTRARRRSPFNQHLQAREYDQRHDTSPSVLQNDMRVIRNHITSPIAPQPARVSPLAVAKVPPLSQRRRNIGENEVSFQGPRSELPIAMPSSNIAVQPLSSRKRRREIDNSERTRNVAPRRDLASPEIRIKNEPMSPPPFTGAREAWQPPHRQEVQRPIYIDNDPPQSRDRRVISNRRPLDRPAEVYVPGERRPTTPVVRRIVSRVGHRFEPYGEPDLRRVVSARQVRAALSPVEQYAVPHPSSTRAASQVYLPQSGMARDYRASVQPQPVMYPDHDRSPSPIIRQVRATPVAREPIPMAPPARRVIQDEFGNRYIEAPLPPERHSSVAPVRRASEFAPRYGEVVQRSASIRDPQVEAYDESQYAPRALSPTSPRYVEYAPPLRSRPVIDREDGIIYDEDGYAIPREGVRMVEYPISRPVGLYEENIRPREVVTRMQSVRPLSSQYDHSREQFARVQSVHPEQDRIVSSGGRRDLVRQASRQVSVRPEDVYARPSNYAVEERPQYQYTDGLRDRRFVEDEVPTENNIYEAPGGAGRRPLQRL